MRIVLSRKGFDSSAGGRPSPIVGGRPVSLPIPTSRRSRTTYADLGLAELVQGVTRQRIRGDSLCHDDPMFANGRCWFGQCGAAQGHLRRHNVGIGDVFLFFGLFADATGGVRHHRIFGYMKVACAGPPDAVRGHPDWIEPPRPHPHFDGEWNANNTLYHGPAAVARKATPTLRLTAEGGPVNLWNVPPWLRRFGLTYHDQAARWIGDDQLHSAKRGQEFVCDIGDSREASAWLTGIMGEIEA